VEVSVVLGHVLNNTHAVDTTNILWSQQTLSSIVWMMGMGLRRAGPCVQQHTHVLATTSMLWPQQNLKPNVCMMGMGHQLSAGP
jgi:hypothetical protein